MFSSQEPLSLIVAAEILYGRRGQGRYARGYPKAGDYARVGRHLAFVQRAMPLVGAGARRRRGHRNSMPHKTRPTVSRCRCE